MLKRVYTPDGTLFVEIADGAGGWHRFPSVQGATYTPGAASTTEKRYAGLPTRTITSDGGDGNLVITLDPGAGMLADRILLDAVDNHKTARVRIRRGVVQEVDSGAAGKTIAVAAQASATGAGTVADATGVGVNFNDAQWSGGAKLLIDTQLFTMEDLGVDKAGAESELKAIVSLYATLASAGDKTVEVNADIDTAIVQASAATDWKLIQHALRDIFVGTIQQGPGYAADNARNINSTFTLALSAAPTEQAIIAD